MKTKPLRATTAVCLMALLQAGNSQQQAADLSGFLTEPRFELPPGITSAPITLEWESNQVLVPVRINGADAGLFQVNSAERESFINADVARRLGLMEIPEFGPVTRMLRNIGLEQGFLGATDYYRVDHLECGAAVMSDVRLFPTRSMDEHSEGREERQIRENFMSKVSGTIGWDLLRTMPFLLNQPELRLVWQSHASPPEGAVALPITERAGVPHVEVTLGDGCKTLALVKISGSGDVVIARDFVKLHHDRIWRGPVFKEPGWLKPAILDDDDRLPVDYALCAQTGVGHWLDVECGGLKFTSPACAVGRERSIKADVEIGYGMLRRVQAVFDGPGKKLWIKTAETSPEITSFRNLQSEASQEHLLTLARDAILMDDAAAVEILTSPGSPMKWNVPELDLLQLACRRRSHDVAHVLLRAGAKIEPAKDHTLTPLLSACEIGDAEMIRLLLKKGADARRIENGASALLLACGSGNVDAVNALAGIVSMPADPHERTTLVLNAAVMGGDFQQLRKHIDKLPPESFAVRDWASALEWFLLSGNVQAVEWVLEKQGAGLAKRKATLPPLLAAILPTRFEKTDAVRERMVNLLLDAGADPNASSMGVTPLLLAARHGNAGIVSRLLAAGARVSAKDHKQRNALYRAAMANQPAGIVKHLLDAGIDPDEVDMGAEITPLSWYVMHGNVEACRSLLQAGADPNGDPLFPLTKPLTCAFGFNFSGDEESCREIVTLLLRHGARVMGLKGDPEQCVPVISIIPGRKPGLIPLMTAVQKPPFQPDSRDAASYLMMTCLTADAETLRELLDLGIKPSMPDEEGYSPLANAAATGQIANMVLLLERGVSPDDGGKNGVPPIWRAAAYGQTRAVRLLLAAGANPDAIHPERKTTPLEVARKRADRAIIACLGGVKAR